MPISPTAVAPPPPGADSPTSARAGLKAAVLLVSALAAGAGVAAAQCEPRDCPPVACSTVRPADEVWLVSTRCLPTCGCFDPEQLQCWQAIDDQWVSRGAVELISAHQQNDNRQLVLYIHGNRTDLQWSITRGWQVYQALFADAPPEHAVRFVIWSWPTDPMIRRVKEYVDHSRASLAEGDRLAAWLQWAGSQRPIGLVGYSFGAQSVVRCAEVVCGPSLAEDPPYELRIAMIAPALQQPWVDRCQPLDGAQPCVSSSLQLDNSRDRALRFHRIAVRFIDGGSVRGCWAGDAAGESGFETVATRFDVGAFVGKEHSVARYLTPAWIADQVRQAVLDGNHGEDAE